MSKGYIPAAETVAAARSNNMSVGDYLEEIYQLQGSRQEVLDNLGRCGAFNRVESILEIGPGSGMFLEQVLNRCNPARYEIYETASDWNDYLCSEYQGRIITQPADGWSLSSTASNSIDLLHSHGVFVYLSFLNSYSYFKEIARVIRSDGFVSFDFFDEQCFTGDLAQKWLQSGHDYPCFLGLDYVKDFFQNRGFSHCGDFFTVCGEGRSHYLIFHKS